MPSLSSTDDRFGVRFSVIEGGAGDFTGIISEPGQGEVPSYQFNLPRRLMRVGASLPLAAGMVIKTPEGSIFMIGKHGDSEGRQGPNFRTFRLFEASDRYSWQRRGKELDPVSRLEIDTGLIDRGLIWGAYEPSPEMFDRQLRNNFETARFITTADVKRDDVVNGMKVSRVDLQLGLRLVTLG